MFLKWTTLLGIPESVSLTGHSIIRGWQPGWRLKLLAQIFTRTSPEGATFFLLVNAERKKRKKNVITKKKIYKNLANSHDVKKPCQFTHRLCNTRYTMCISYIYICKCMHCEVYAENFPTTLLRWLRQMLAQFNNLTWPRLGAETFFHAVAKARLFIRDADSEGTQSESLWKHRQCFVSTPLLSTLGIVRSFPDSSYRDFHSAIMRDSDLWITLYLHG